MKFSIIVPVYGVEKYLDQCVQSVLAQSYTDFEVILVDDKSPDNCPAMCDEWAKMDSRIRVIHKPQNEGLGFARNTGIDAACGEYVLFLDSDDTLAPDTLEQIERLMVADTDIFICGMELHYEDKNGMVQWVDKIEPLDFLSEDDKTKPVIFAKLITQKVFQYACNKAYRRAFLLSVPTRFEKTKLIEDFLFNIAVFKPAKVIQSVARSFYRYRKPAHVTLASRYDPDFFELCKRRYLLQEDFLQTYDAFSGEPMDVIHRDYLKHVISVLLKNCSRSAGLSHKQQKEKAAGLATDPVTVRVVEQMHPAGLQFKVIHFALKHKMAGFLLLYSGAVSFVQKQLLPLYRKFL